MTKKALKILLIKSPSYSDVISPPLGIGYLAAAVRDIAEVELIDGVNSHLTSRSLVDILNKSKPDIIGFSIVSAAAKNAVQLIKTAAKTCPGAVIVAGGPHPSTLPQVFIDETGDSLDYILRGDAELSFKMLVQNFSRIKAADTTIAEIKHIPGIYARVKDGLVANDIYYNKELDALGIPAWNLMPPDKYPMAPHGAFYKKYPVAPILTSRGCSYNCGFCSVPKLKGRTIRYRSPKLVAEEIKLLREKFGVREIQIIDDNFTTNKKHALAICNEIIKNDLIMPWSCPNGVRVDALDDELLDTMKAAGCYSISVGIESGSREILKRMNKRLNIDKVYTVIDKIVSKDIEVNAFFILGYPGETRAYIEETIALSKKLPLTRANFALFTPIPGCSEFNDIQKDTHAKSKYQATYAQVGYLPEGFTARQLKNFQRRSILEFYIRPRQMRKLISAVNSPEQAFFIARRAIHWLVGK